MKDAYINVTVLLAWVFGMAYALPVVQSPSLKAFLFICMIFAILVIYIQCDMLVKGWFKKREGP